MKYEVTTGETAYETYTVEAESREEAKTLVLNSGTRAQLPSRCAGSDGEPIIVAVVEAAD